MIASAYLFHLDRYSMPIFYATQCMDLHPHLCIISWISGHKDDVLVVASWLYLKLILTGVIANYVPSNVSSIEITLHNDQSSQKSFLDRYMPIISENYLVIYSEEE